MSRIHANGAASRTDGFPSIAVNRRNYQAKCTSNRA